MPDLRANLSYPPMTDTLYDREEALERLGGDESLLATLIDMFLADAPESLEEMDEAWRTADLPRLSRAAHTLKGMLATFSARPAQAAALALEVAARAGESQTCAAHVEATRHETARFVAALRAPPG